MHICYSYNYKQVLSSNASYYWKRSFFCYILTVQYFILFAPVFDSIFKVSLLLRGKIAKLFIYLYRTNLSTVLQKCAIVHAWKISRDYIFSIRVSEAKFYFNTLSRVEWFLKTKMDTCLIAPKTKIKKSHFSMVCFVWCKVSEKNLTFLRCVLCGARSQK